MVVSKNALACPPKLEDYPKGKWLQTTCLLVLMLGGWVMAWLWQMAFTYTVGWFLKKKRLELWNGYLFRLFSAAPVAYLTPGVRLRVTKTSWKPPRDVIEGKKAVIVAANHRSFMDPFALAGGLLPLETKYVAKAELFQVPFGGWAMYRAGDLAVKFDKNKNQGWGTVKGSTKELLLQATDQLTSGNSIAIFPEGTRMGFVSDKALEAGQHESKLMAFKPPFFDLAKKLDVPVVCVAMRGTDEVWPVGSNMMRPADIIIDIAEPMNPNDYATDQEFADAARLKMGKMYQALCKDY
ncbi:hypothetical protein CTAYLR_003636 [Chrysophaeum taylorii]|uniref:Phospholipid/glycerol acyltransferase domain-containing protein n=1 Tax=Chrysophaeum taylorii TaxID=2483200 RepID=A0AAD7UEL5_9STRA|nr:hypothetical protein CTAYLR_003636 [Chrysophaeum taylorii]